MARNTKNEAKFKAQSAANEIARAFGFPRARFKITGEDDLHDYVATAVVAPKNAMGRSVEVIVSKLKPGTGFADAGKNVMEVAAFEGDLMTRGGLIYRGTPGGFKVTDKVLQKIARAHKPWFARCRPTVASKDPRSTARRRVVIAY